MRALDGMYIALQDWTGCLHAQSAEDILCTASVLFWLPLQGDSACASFNSQTGRGVIVSSCRASTGVLPAWALTAEGLPLQEPPMRQLMFDQLLTSASRCYIELGKQYEALGELACSTARLTAIEHSPMGAVLRVVTNVPPRDRPHWMGKPHIAPCWQP